MSADLFSEIVSRLQRVSKPDTKGNVTALCPFHADRERPNLSVHPEKGFTCFACGESGSLKKLAGKLGIEPDPNGRKPAKPERWDAVRAAEALAERKLAPDTLKHFNVVADLEKQAWRYPVIGGTRWKAFTGSAAPRKYWHSRNTPNQLYGLGTLREGGENVWLVNGEPSVWAMWQVGLPAVCGLYGEGVLPENTAEQLRARGLFFVHVCLDLDPRGRRAALDVAEKLRADGLAVILYRLPDYLGEHGDVADLYRWGDGDNEKFREALRGLPDLDPEDAPEPDGEEMARPDGRQVLTATELLDLQAGPVDWLLADLIPSDGLAILAGAPGTGKTFLALDLALGMSCGGRTWGKDARPGPCLYVDAENSPRLLAQRLRGLLEGRHLSPPDGLHFLPGANLSLTKPDDVAFLSAAIAQSGARLVILDSLVRFLGGADENDASHVSTAMGELRRLATVNGCAVLLLHHLRKSGALSVGTILESVRGSGDLVAAVDTVLVLRGSDGSGNVTAAKSRWVETPPPFGFSIASAGSGLVITTGEATGAGKKLVEQVIETLMDILRESKAPLSRKEIDALLEGKGIEAGERTVDTALATLRHAGRVSVAKVGRVNTYGLQETGGE